MIKMPFLYLNNLNDFNYSHVKKCVMLSIIFWTIYLYDLARNYIGKLWAFQWVLIVLLFFQICFCFVMRATSLSTYDFSTLYTTLPHNLIKDKRIDLIERTFQREGSPYLACNDRNAFFTSEKPKKYHAWSCQNVCDALIFLLNNIFIRFGTKLYRQVVGIPMGTNCAPLVAD